MSFKARTLKKNSFIFGFGRGAQVGEASSLEVNLRRKGRRWAQRSRKMESFQIAMSF